MSLINELLQFLRRTEAATGSKERRYMIAKRTIVGVLLNSHHLNTVIAILNDTRQDILAELVIRTHLLSVLSHAYMALIDKQRTLLGLEVFLLEIIFFCRIPHLSREYLRILVLYHTTAPCRNTFTFATVPLHFHLVKLTMLQVTLT